jgi:hypothetical protein
MNKEPIECPHCKVSLLGSEIPEEHRKYYNDKRFYSRLIGLYDPSYDRVTNWMCPDCTHIWEKE